MSFGSHVNVACLSGFPLEKNPDLIACSPITKFILNSKLSSFLFTPIICLPFNKNAVFSEENSGTEDEFGEDEVLFLDRALVLTVLTVSGLTRPHADSTSFEAF